MTAGAPSPTARWPAWRAADREPAGAHRDAAGGRLRERTSHARSPSSGRAAARWPAPRRCSTSCADVRPQPRHRAACETNVASLGALVPWMAERPALDGRPTAYVCVHGRCDLPATDARVTAGTAHVTMTSLRASSRPGARPRFRVNRWAPPGARRRWTHAAEQVVDEQLVPAVEARAKRRPCSSTSERAAATGTTSRPPVHAVRRTQRPRSKNDRQHPAVGRRSTAHSNSSAPCLFGRNPRRVAWTYRDDSLRRAQLRERARPRLQAPRISA